MLSTRDGVVISISGLVALAMAYLMVEASRREQRAELEATLQAMESRLLAGLLSRAEADKQSAPIPDHVPHTISAVAPSTSALAPTEPEAPARRPEAAAPKQAVVPSSAPSSAGAPTHPLLGSWRCSFRSGEHSYPPMACVIRRNGDAYTLEKTQGSQRIRGTITLDGDARFAFSGLFFCPHGACDSEVRGDFARKSNDHWVGTLRDHESGDVVVTLRRPVTTP